MSMQKHHLYYLLLSSFCIWLYAIQPNYAQNGLPGAFVLSPLTSSNSITFRPVTLTATITSTKAISTPLISPTTIISNQVISGNTVSPASVTIIPAKIISDSIIAVTQVITPAPIITQTNLITSSIDPTRPQVTSKRNNFDIVSFEMLGVKEQLLNSPLGSYTLRLGLPASQQLITGTELNLDFNITSLLSNVTPSGSLQVLFNRVLLTELPITELGNKQLSLPISATAFIPQSADGRHEVGFKFQSSSADCNTLSVVIEPSSTLVLARKIVTPLIDLQFLPRPIYQNTFLSDPATFVLPDKPTTTELQAALATANAFGQMTAGGLVFSTTTLSQLTAEQRESTHLIFIGTSQAFPLLQQVTLPAPIGEVGFEATAALPDDGIIQMAVSPWNPEKVVLVVGGNSDLAVFKAGQAISTGEVRISNQPNLAIIADLYNQDDTVYISDFDQTLSDLGYEEQTVLNGGVNKINFPFNMPMGYYINDAAYFNLIYNHSTLFDFSTSNVTVRLNNRSLKSVRLTPDGANPTTLKVNIPRSLVHPGTNDFVVSANLMPDTTNKCMVQNSDDFWFTVWADSSFHLPLKKNPPEIKSVFSLQNYPSPFDFNKTLTTTVFLLPATNSVAWNVATQIAFNLGRRVQTNIAQFKVAFADDIPAELRQNHHFIAIGLPNELPIVSQLKKILPASFEPGSNLAIENGVRIRPRIITGTHIGYLQIVPLPWNGDYSVLMVLGTSNEGLQLANTLLISSSLQSRLKYSLAIIEGTQITMGSLKIDFSPPVTSNTVIPSMVETDTMTTTVEISKPLASNAAPPPKARPSWMFPVIATATLAMFIVILIVISSSWKKYYVLISVRLKKMNISIPTFNIARFYRRKP